MEDILLKLGFKYIGEEQLGEKIYHLDYYEHNETQCYDRLLFYVTLWKNKMKVVKRTYASHGESSNTMSFKVNKENIEIILNAII